MRSEASTETLDGRQHGGGGSTRDAREGRVRGGISRMRSVPKDLHSVLGDQRTALPSRCAACGLLCVSLRFRFFPVVLAVSANAPTGTPHQMAKKFRSCTAQYSYT